jgi:hypothetical protein
MTLAVGPRGAWPDPPWTVIALVAPTAQRAAQSQVILAGMGMARTAWRRRRGRGDCASARRYEAYQAGRLREDAAPCRPDPPPGSSRWVCVELFTGVWRQDRATARRIANASELRICTE